VRAFTDPALSALRRYGWPGNVRELSHVVERAVLMTPGDSIGPADLRLTGGTAAGSHGAGQPVTLDAIEQEAIRAALARHAGNVIAAAEELGVSRSALYRRMEKLGL
jgi:DNA-binding NtrC family response regulator